MPNVGAIEPWPPILTHFMSVLYRHFPLLIFHFQGSPSLFHCGYGTLVRCHMSPSYVGICLVPFQYSGLF